MKKITKLFQIILLMTMLGNGWIAKAQTISPYFFGQNAWMPDTIGNANQCTDPPCILNGKLHKQWANIKASGASIIRFGGIAADKNMPTNYQYVRMIDSIRVNGMEPMLQVPYRMNRYTPQQAAAIVQYVNITMGRHVKYWIIANEPDLGYSYSSASQIAAYFRPFASAMKAVDPSILIVGPELAWFNQTIMNGLTAPNGVDDITGMDAAGHTYCDIITFHTYPFNGSQTRDDLINSLTAPFKFKANLEYLNTRLAAANAAHGRSGSNTLKIAVTEANVSWQNNASENLYGNGTNSFIGGQFWAEMMSIGMKNSLEFLNFWSVVEGNSISNNIGYVNPSDGMKKPTYYHFQMLAQNFRGQYIDGTTNNTKVKAFGSKDGQQISVMIMNQELAANLPYTIRLSSSAVTGTVATKVNINAGLEIERTDTIQNQTSVVLVFNSAGFLVKKITYSLAGQAAANLPPAVINYSLPSDSVATNPATGIEGAEDTKFSARAYPNPCIGKLNLKLNNLRAPERTIQVTLFNILGQEVYNTKQKVYNNKIDFDFAETFAAGAYILNVTEGTNKMTQKLILEK